MKTLMTVIVTSTLAVIGLAACGNASAHNASATHTPKAASATTPSASAPTTASGPQSTSTPNCPQVNSVLDSVFDGSYAGLPPAKST
jgi:uncharacterized lipoprotein